MYPISRSRSDSPRFATRAACTSIFMRAMSTPVGHSRRQALHETQSFIVSAISSEDSASGPDWPGMAAAAGAVALVAGDAVARAHHAAREHAAGAVVVAHLDRALETAAGAGVGPPIEMGGDGFGTLVRSVTEP